MKKIIFFLFNMFLLTSCEEVIDVDLDTEDPRLVIDAKILRNHNTNGAEIETEVEVILSLTTPFFETSSSFVNNAEISITDLSTGTVYSLINSFSGRYFISNPESFEVKDNTEYLLNVVYNGEIYESKEVLNPSAPIDSLFQLKNDNAFRDPEDIAVCVSFTDIEGIGNHYIFKFDDINFLTTNDEFTIDGSPFTLNYFHEDPQSDILRVDLLGSDEMTNNYVESINELSEGGNNGPFSTVPFEVRGNIVNTTNSSNFPFGYFRINEVFKTAISIVDNDDALELDCEIDENEL